MSKRKPSKIFICLLIASMIVSIFPATALSGQAIVDTNVLNLRAGPGISHNKLGQVTMGTPVDIINSKDNWYQISLPDQMTAWVSGDYISQATQRTVAFVNTNNLNVRTGPSVQYPSIGRVHYTEEFNLIEESNGWYKISYYNGSGWISALYANKELRIIKEASPEVSLISSNTSNTKESENSIGTVTVSKLNIRSGPSISTEKIGQLDRGVLVTIVNKENREWLEIKLQDGRKGWVAAEYIRIGDVTNSTAKPITSKEAVINVPVLNVKSEPSSTSEKVAQVKQGESFPILETKDDWLKIKMNNGGHAWVTTQFVLVKEIGEETTKESREKLKSYITVDIEKLNVRTGPGTAYEKITQLMEGTRLPIIEINNEWYLVELTNDTEVKSGWIFGPNTVLVEHIDTESDGETEAEENIVNEEMIANSSFVKDKTILIDAGHGGRDGGAKSPSGLLEKVVNLEVALKLEELLKGAGANVILTRTTDTYLTLGERVDIAEKNKADVFVSIHANAHPNPSISGVESFYYNGKARSLESYHLTSALQVELSKQLGLKDMGVKNRSFHIVRETSMPASLVELGFLTNSQDEELLKSSSARTRAAEAIFTGLENYFRY